MLQRMNENQKVCELFDSFFEAVDKLTDIKVHSDLLTSMLLYSLPVSYENFRRAIESRDELPKPEQLRVKTIEEDSSIGNAQVDKREGAMDLDKYPKKITGGSAKMASFTPIMLSGNNLGQRHQCLNTLVREAKESEITIQDFEALPEESPVDRLFKIYLAIELKHVDYIIRNLKDDDMLYVSRALKSTWLIDHHDIINPKYLEDVLFPEMITPAVTKMKHWLYINLRDPAMCQEFYQHYKESTFEFALKFLSHCSHEFILAETPKILTKLSTHSLKVLSENCPRVAKIYFDSLATDEDVKTRYLAQEQSYYISVKCLLKADPDVFLDITEKYFNMNSFSRFSALATDYILRCHKTRFTNKLELYVAYLLHIPTLAARLSVEECQEVVLKLARASYLQHWFQYKVVEPLIKRLRPDKRAAFKKLVFVEKNVGERVQDWPYPTPESPPHSDSDPHIFDDEDFSPICESFDFRCMLKKKKYSRFGNHILDSCVKVKSDLDRLFDEFRFTGFDRALHDLGQRLGAAGSADRRRNIFLVLVSKSGGRSDAVSALLRLAARHSNEPPHTRASILRSLVKRANVWRLAADVWQHFLDFGHGLGLDGTPFEAACREGLHCVVIRQLLAGQCEQAVRDAFLNDFSTLAEYSLKVDEQVRVANGLQNMLAAAAIDMEPAVTAERLHQLLDVIEVYHVRVEKASPTVEAVKRLAVRDAEVACSLLERLYDARIGRCDLLRENLKFRCDQGALMNALRHDPPALELEKVADILATGQSQFDGFVSKLVIYFNQKEDLLTIQLRSALNEKIAQQQNDSRKNVKLARPLASLLYKDFEKELRELDAGGKESVKLAAALRACAHRARPVVNLAEWGWRKAGVKAVATRAMRCREIERAELTRALAAERRTIRVALALSMRSAGPGGLLLETFVSAAKLHPVVALHVVLPYFHRHGASADAGVWDIVKPLFSSVDLTFRERLRQLLRKTKLIPSNIKPDYCGTLYFLLDKISKSGSDFVLRDLFMLLPEVREDMIEKILLRMLEEEPEIRYPAIFVRYLMLSRNHEDLETRFAKVGGRFLERLENLRCEENSNFQQRLDQIMKCLKYNAAFLDTKYTSCLSVIERVLASMQKFMPKEKYFEKYVHIHLTMLYFKAVRQSMKQMPEVFADPKKRKSAGVESVGFVFGRYIVKEVAELVSTYFDSVVELYTGALVDYLVNNFMYGISRATFIASVLKAILTEAVGIQRRMAVYILRDLRYDVKDFMRKEIEELMAQEKCIELLVHAEIFN